MSEKEDFGIWQKRVTEPSREETDIVLLFIRTGKELKVNPVRVFQIRKNDVILCLNRCMFYWGLHPHREKMSRQDI